MARKPTTQSAKAKEAKAKAEAQEALVAVADFTIQAAMDRIKALDKAHIDLHNLVGELKERLQEATDLIEKIRYQDWPTRGLGIGLTPEEMDEILAKVFQTRVKSTRVLRKHKHLFPQVEKT